MDGDWRHVSVSLRPALAGILTQQAFAASQESYVEMVTNDGAILYIPLDDASGTAAVATIGSDGTYAGSPTLHVTGPSSELPFGFATDGSDDKMTTASLTGLGSTQAQSWEVWFDAPATLESTVTRGLLSRQNTQDESFVWGSITGAISGEVLTVLHVGARSGWTGFTVPTGWHHLVLTFSGTAGEWTAYVDGANIEGSPWNATAVDTGGGAPGFSSSAFALANYWASSGFYAWDGLASLAVYDLALNSTQVLEHYNKGS